VVRAAGTAYWEATRERIPEVAIKAASDAGDVKFALSDDDGDFSFDALQPGRWTFLALHEHSIPAKIEVELQADRNDLRFLLSRLMDTADERVGRRFFLFLSTGLLVLAVLYTLLHLAFPSTQPGFFWRAEPWRFLEVLLWGLAGILTSLIITTGGYFRRNRFYREGLYQHLAQIVTIPLLALVAVLILSLATLRITLAGGNEVQLDLSDPTILAAVSFLIGSRPWEIWGFVRETAGRITGLPAGVP
jgi:hypothetical protein